MNIINTSNNYTKAPSEPVKPHSQNLAKCVMDRINYLNLSNTQVLKAIKNSKKKPTSDELSVLRDLTSIMDRDQLRELWKGAHIRISDGGELYKKWSELNSARSRISSHPHVPGSKQYGIQGPLTHEILFGICENEKGEIETWIQLENTPLHAPNQNLFETIITIAMHTLDFFCYILKGKNIGPYGSSIHTDGNPLRLPKVSIGDCSLA